MAVPIIHDWERYYHNPHEGLGSSYERIIINQMLLQVATQYQIQTALEAPAFGFTGLSGINLVALAKAGIKVTLEDHDPQRLQYIRALWQQLALPLQSRQNRDYRHLDYPDKAFELGFNFSALWFVHDLPSFLSEFCRVVSKAILICVPNQEGIGFRMQIRDYSPQRYPELKPQHLMPAAIIRLMRREGWELVQRGYIDCPPWPDIGMDKERFVGKLLKKELPKPGTASPPLSILPYYQDLDPGFAARMLRYAWLEKLAPDGFKRHWAHHYRMLFVPRHES